ncbi:hypothetical protein [Streptomyces mashuensis]|uniref:hypothetical protein n=1 Tax=Streptomyces mashuensis TaxID=33904 RepID=UPI00167ED0C9|nr:hypothetical protein [Streptomyces mashuensis]
MEAIRLLEDAGLLTPEEAAGPGDLTERDVWDQLARDEWEQVLGVLEECRGGPPLPPAFWASLAEAVGQLRMERGTAWCHWRHTEARRGGIRAVLTLFPPEEADGGRRLPVPGAGVLRPMWDIGSRAPDGGPAWNIASLWAEHTAAIPPGGRATVRLAPLTPGQWRHLTPGDVITMHERRPPAGTATVLEVLPPVLP